MSVLFYGIILILAAFLLHLLFWKIHLPGNQTGALLFIFLGTLICGIFILRKYAANYELLHLVILFISSMLAYIVTYSAVEVDSPSISMALSIAEAGRKGLDLQALLQEFNDDSLVVSRLKDLKDANMIYSVNGIYRPRLKGIILGRIFIIYRKILKAQQKGG